MQPSNPNLKALPSLPPGGSQLPEGGVSPPCPKPSQQVLQYLCNDQKLEQEPKNRHSGLVFACVPGKLDSADINKIMDLDLEKNWGGGWELC